MLYNLYSELYSKDKNVRVLCQLVVFSSVISIASSFAFDSINAKRCVSKLDQSYTGYDLLSYYPKLTRLTLKTLYFIKPITLDVLVSSILVEISLVLAAFLLHPLFKVLPLSCNFF